MRRWLWTMLLVISLGSFARALDCPYADCGRELPFGARVCPHCKRDLNVTTPCPTCGKPVKFGWAYCETCGSKLTWKAGQFKPAAGAAPAAAEPGVGGQVAPAGRAPRVDGEKLDKQVQEAIDKAVKYLWAARREDGSWNPEALWARKLVGPDEDDDGGGTRRAKKLDKARMTRVPFPVGTTALACYALLESGVNPQDERMKESLVWLVRQPTTRTYSLGLRANVWLAAARRDRRYLMNLRRDVGVLVRSAPSGLYSYNCTGRPPTKERRGFPVLGGYLPGDHSNSQYGLLGVWAGARADGAIVPNRYWLEASKYWRAAQNDDGGWSYTAHHRVGSYPSMTVAGLASLFVCRDNLDPGRFASCGVNTKDPAIERGLAWLARTVGKISLDSVRGPSGRSRRQTLDMYYLFGVERVGLASGYKHFGELDWYAEGVRRILAAQKPDGLVPSGGWGSPTVGTAYAVLFLVRGRHPVVFNKLQFDGDWNNRPRDLAGLTRWLSKTFERTVNWQIVRLGEPVEQWHDAPILYVSGSRNPNFTPVQIDQLRAFVHQGGTIFSVTECDGSDFSRGMRDAYDRMFPGYRLKAMPASHPMFQVHFRTRGMKFSLLTNGVRPWAIHCDYDLPLAWQQRASQTRKWTFEVAANVAMYVTGRGALRPRGVTHWPAEPAPFTPERTIRIVRLKHAGQWNPEPLAYVRLARLLALRDRIRLKVLPAVDIADLASTGAKIAVLTGTGELAAGETDRRALKAFVAGGGTLIVDAAGGDEAFTKSARDMLEVTFDQAPRALASSADVYRLPKRRITKVHYRGEAKRRLGGSVVPALQGVTVGERLGVLFSREDLTGALVGYESTTCSGYVPESAYQIMRNALLYASGARPGGGD